MAKSNIVCEAKVLGEGAKSKIVFWSTIFLFFLLKLILVSANEIVAIPFDSIQYVRHSLNSVFSIGPAPGYPIWLAAGSWTGIPQRVLIELFLGLCCLALALVASRKFGRFAAVLVFIFLLLSPTTFFMFDSALSDGFYACLNVLALALSGGLIFSERYKITLVYAAALGSILGSMALTRNEDPLLFCWGGVVLAGFWFARTRRAIEVKQLVTLRSCFLLSVIMLTAAVAPVSAVNLLHYYTSGVYARSVAGLPGHMRLLGSLARIETGEENIRFVPVSARARKLAYDASPTLNKVSSLIEDRNGAFQKASRDNGIPDGEIGAGWTWHVFNHAILDSLQTSDARRWEQEYRSINSELDAAFDSGQLRKRFVWHSFMTAPIIEVLRRAPSALISVGRKAFNAHEYTEDLGHEALLFDTVAMRRSALITGSYSYSLQGWVFASIPGRTVKAVHLIDEEGRELPGVSRMDRPDVENAYGRVGGWRPDVLGFKIDWESRSNKKLFLSFSRDDGTTVANSTLLLQPGVLASGGESGVPLLQGTDYANFELKQRNGWRHQVQRSIVDLANRPLAPDIWLAICLATILLAAYMSPRDDSSHYRSLVFCFFVLMLLLLRVLFYGLLESEAWVVEIRYMLPANLMVTIVLALMAARVGLGAQRRLAAIGRG